MLHDAKIVPATTLDVVPDQGHLHVSVDGEIVAMNFGLSDRLTGVAPASTCCRSSSWRPITSRSTRGDRAGHVRGPGVIANTAAPAGRAGATRTETALLVIASGAGLLALAGAAVLGTSDERILVISIPMALGAIGLLAPLPASVKGAVPASLVFMIGLAGVVATLFHRRRSARAHHDRARAGGGGRDR